MYASSNLKIKGDSMGIKDYYDSNYIEMISNQMLGVCPSFPKEKFVSSMCERVSDQTYSEKMKIISEGLNECFSSYDDALKVFTAILGKKMESMSEMYDVGMRYAPFGKFIEMYAVENEVYFDNTLDYIYELTQRYTGEFAMRPLLAAFPERTVTVIEKWTDDESDCVRRLCSECMRVSIPWASKLNFALDYFEIYSKILIKLSNDECEYVRRSVANNINELCKVDLDKAKTIINEISKINGKYAKTLITHGTRWARKKGMM